MIVAAEHGQAGESRETKRELGTVVEQLEKTVVHEAGHGSPNLSGRMETGNAPCQSPGHPASPLATQVEITGMIRAGMASDLRATFERDGFVVIPDFVPPAACAELRDAALALAEAALPDALAHESVFDARGQRHGADPWFLDSGGEVRAFLEPRSDAGTPRVNKLGHALHDRIPLFDRFSRTPELAVLVHELGMVAPLLLQSMVIFKHPRVGGEVPAHQDATYLYTEPLALLGLWFALEPATRENGCLELLVGGSREPLRERYRRATEGGARSESLDVRPFPREPWRRVEAEVGTLVAFHGLTPHRSAANRSEQPRCAYTLHLIEAGAHYPDDNWLLRPDLPLRGFSG